MLFATFWGDLLVKIKAITRSFLPKLLESFLCRTGLCMWECVCMCKHGVVDVGVCAHVHARAYRCGSVRACAGTGLQVWVCVHMSRHGAAEVWGHRAAGVGVCAHVQARCCGCG
eukprot:1369094-Pyramimonas_sp.AAC.1